ncbi:hypothetical protein Poli38472_014525 [Pythium oligandrum]|uniref:Myb-like DNA-binding protein n=1 Tax=Pythium oligandrum TaxID=41045 RepID=A0A8K1FHJ0_PYTOL|nr:hypothetical protein Poli38472_014525 [Pythium oligandrum]|eukprot:TMW61064.1 hypothetical protein Poli38472_014525 [Pythium oligandrum]
MTISKRVQGELVQATPSLRVPERKRANCAKNTTRQAKAQREAIAAKTKGQAWTKEEHDRFLEGLKLFPSGPWEAIAEHVGTKNSRQTMTHAQKYRQKFERQQRGLRNIKKQKKKKTMVARGVVAPKPEIEIAVPVLKSEDEEDYAIESPRSAEEECVQVEPEVAAPMEFDINKFDSLSMVEFFSEFDQTMQLQMWSTNSLTDLKSEIQLEELTVFSDDFSQSLGLWAL